MGGEGESAWKKKFILLDKFAKPVSFNFNGEHKYKSCCGAIVSIIYGSIIMVSLIKSMIKVRHWEIVRLNYIELSSTWTTEEGSFRHMPNQVLGFAIEDNNEQED